MIHLTDSVKVILIDFFKIIEQDFEQDAWMKNHIINVRNYALGDLHKIPKDEIAYTEKWIRDFTRSMTNLPSPEEMKRKLLRK